MRAGRTGLSAGCEALAAWNTAMGCERRTTGVLGLPYGYW